MKEQSHKDEMSAALRADFRRLRDRGVAATLAPRDADWAEPDAVEVEVEVEAAAPQTAPPKPEPPDPASEAERDVEPEPEAESESEPGPAAEEPIGRQGLFARIFR